MLAYGKALDEGIYDVKLENGKVAEVTAAESVGGCTVKRVDGETLYLAERGERLGRKRQGFMMRQEKKSQRRILLI